MTCSHWRSCGSCDAAQQELGAAQDRGQQVVEVVGDAGGHLAEGAELLGPHELILGGGQLAVRARALLVEPRAGQGERGEVRDVDEQALLGLGERPLGAAQRRSRRARGRRALSGTPSQ